MAAAPILSIRMNSTLPPSQTLGLEVDDMLERLDVLISQDTLYKADDYLSRRSAEEKKDDSDGDPLNSIDASCREKMCEWSYRVCDHFKVPRMVVAIAFSYLDRFVNRCSCDRTAFKLASMTALYIATKVFNGRQLSIATLAELSRGEFEVNHISEMERIMLNTLHWKLNPPITQDFIQYFVSLIPSTSFRNMIEQRASFFAELCVYDYDLILHDRAMIALAAVFNAIDAIDESILSRELKLNILDSVQERYPHLDRPSLMKTTRRRLWYLYSCSAQVQEDNPVPILVEKESVVHSSQEKGRRDVASSPVSVATKGRY